MFFFNISPEHFNPLLEEISKLEEALYNIQFEQHWLEAQTDRQALGNSHEFSAFFVLSTLVRKLFSFKWDQTPKMIRNKHASSLVLYLFPSP